MSKSIKIENGGIDLDAAIKRMPRQPGEPRMTEAEALRFKESIAGDRAYFADIDPAAMAWALIQQDKLEQQAAEFAEDRAEVERLNECIRADEAADQERWEALGREIQAEIDGFAAADRAWEALQRNTAAQEADFQAELNATIRRPQGFLKRVFVTVGKLVLRK